MKHRVLPLAALVLALAAPLMGAPLAHAVPTMQAAPAKEVVFWQGTSLGRHIRWTNKDLTVSGPKTGFSAKAESLKWAKDMMADGTCEADHGTAVLSVVGPIVSVLDAKGGNCVPSAHPFADRIFIARDVTRVTEKAKLTSYFPPAQIHQALMADPIIKKALAGKKPATLDALMTALESASGDCQYQLDREMLSQFAFHHVKGNQVAVRIGLTHGCGAARGMLTQLGLYLPIPKVLAGYLKEAERGKQGFLMARAPQQMTVFVYGKPHRSWIPKDADLK